MERRDLLKAFVAVIPGVSVGGLELSEGDDLIAFKISTAYAISESTRENIRREWQQIFGATKWARVPVLLCQDGLDISLVKRSDADAPQA